MEDNNMHAGHRERMITRLIEQGEQTFETHELLEMLLYSSVKRADTNPLAHRLIDRFGSLNAVLNAKREDLMQVNGVGNATAQMIITMRAVIVRLLQESVKRGEQLSDSVQVREYCEGLFKFADSEQVRIICIDSSYRFISQNIVSTGSIEQVTVDVMKIMEQILAKRCPIVILTHNHPRGTEIPSAEDKRITRNLYNLLEKAEVYLADHIVVGSGGSFSMREGKLLPDVWNEL